MFKKHSSSNNNTFLKSNNIKKQQQRSYIINTKPCSSLSKSTQSLSIQSFTNLTHSNKSIIEHPSLMNISKGETKPTSINKIKRIKLSNSRNKSCKEQQPITKIEDLMLLIKQKNFTIRNKNRFSEISINSVADTTQPKSSAETSATSKRIYDTKHKFSGVNMRLMTLGSYKKNERLIHSVRNDVKFNSFMKGDHSSVKKKTEMSSIISEENLFGNKTNSYNKKKMEWKKNIINNSNSNCNYTVCNNTIESIKKKLWKDVEDKKKKTKVKKKNISNSCDNNCSKGYIYNNNNKCDQVYKRNKQKEEFLDVSLTYSEDTLTRRLKERMKIEDNNNNTNTYNKSYVKDDVKRNDKDNEELDFKKFCDMMSNKLFGA